jgi:AmmeMemoRadiSam system protein A
LRKWKFCIFFLAIQNLLVARSRPLEVISMATDDRLTINERSLLLEQARFSVESGAYNHPLKPIHLDDFPQKLRELGVTFVTLTLDQKLRGCVGALEAYQPLVEDVREHALAAAIKDFRFPPVQPNELDKISIEISRLTPPMPLDYEGPDDLLSKLRPEIDGVVVIDETRRATFLPQVWQKLPSAVTFLEHLCQKMGAPPNLWREKKLDILIYQVEEFHE